MMCARHHPSCRNPDGVWQFFCHPLPHRNDGEDGRGRSVDMLDIDRPVLAIIPPIEIDHKIARCQRRSLNWWTALISLCEKMCCGFSFSFLSPFFPKEGRKKKSGCWQFCDDASSRKFDEPCKWERENDSSYHYCASCVFAYFATSLLLLLFPPTPHFLSFLLLGKTRRHCCGDEHFGPTIAT